MEFHHLKHFDSVFQVILTTILTEAINLSSNCTPKILNRVKEMSEATLLTIDCVNKYQI